MNDQRAEELVQAGLAQWIKAREEFGRTLTPEETVREVLDGVIPALYVHLANSLYAERQRVEGDEDYGSAFTPEYRTGFRTGLISGLHRAINITFTSLRLSEDTPR